MANGGMPSSEVLRVLDHLIGRGGRVWVAGGWGVDALAGRQTREHRDLDLAVDSAHESLAIAALAEQSYVVETDWRPVRVELAARHGRWVDLHPVVFDSAGDGVQADLAGGRFVYPARCFVSGVIAGQVVPCLSIAQQITFHTGYQHRDIDVADLRVLRQLPGGGRPTA